MKCHYSHLSNRATQKDHVWKQTKQKLSVWGGRPGRHHSCSKVSPTPWQVCFLAPVFSPLIQWKGLDTGTVLTVRSGFDLGRFDLHYFCFIFFFDLHYFLSFVLHQLYLSGTPCPRLGRYPLHRRQPTLFSLPLSSVIFLIRYAGGCRGQAKAGCPGQPKGDCDYEVLCPQGSQVSADPMLVLWVINA